MKIEYPHPRRPVTVAVNAFILIQAEVGTAGDVAREIGALAQVLSAEVAIGPYDVIARAEAADMDELGAVVVNAIGNVPGVERTNLCPIVNL
jgi:DNA-binding Lrp family transcriptional regulator